MIASFHSVYQPFSTVIVRIPKQNVVKCDLHLSCEKAPFNVGLGQKNCTPKEVQFFVAVLVVFHAKQQNTGK